MYVSTGFHSSKHFNDYLRGYDCKKFDVGLIYIRWNKTFLSKNASPFDKIDLPFESGIIRRR